MDALGSSATTFISVDRQNGFRVPASIREVGGVIDAWMFNMISPFPSNSSNADEAANWKSQVDSHFRRSMAAYHLATAKTGSAYGNITNVVSTDSLSMDNSTEASALLTEGSDVSDPDKTGGSTEAADGVGFQSASAINDAHAPNTSGSSDNGGSINGAGSLNNAVDADNANGSNKGGNPDNAGSAMEAGVGDASKNCTRVEMMTIARAQM